MPPLGLRTSRDDRLLHAAVGRLWMLMVGVDIYADPQLGVLGCAVCDCRELAGALAGLTGRFERRVELVHHAQDGRPPRLGAVRASLAQLVAEAQPEDTVVFYFSGHGVLDRRCTEVFFCLADTRLGALEQTALGLPELLGSLANCRAHQQLLWLDACHSGAGFAPAGANPADDAAGRLVAALQRHAHQRRNLYALLSCDAGEHSWEFPELGHGVFTYHLIRGLRGEAADRQGVIDIDGLYKFVYYQTLRYIDQINKQLRLLNRQKGCLGESERFRLYSLQTPKRFVGGVAPVVLGRSPRAAGAPQPRRALVIESLVGRGVGVKLSRELARLGRFDIRYWSAESVPRQWLALQLADPPVAQTVLVYLGGRITCTGDGDLHLDLGGTAVGLLWLDQQMQAGHRDRRLWICDWVVEPGNLEAVRRWLQSQQRPQTPGLCLMAGLSAPGFAGRFGEALVATLAAAGAGLSVAEWIAKLQDQTAADATHFESWLSSVEGVVEVLPGDPAAPFDVKICPYMGLRAFAEAAAPFFYGRGPLVARLLHALHERSFVAVVGASGCGKSSLVQAGLMAQLRQGGMIPGSGRWRLCTMQPGTHPLANLIARLGESGAPDAGGPDRRELEGLVYLGAEGFVRWLRTRPEPVLVLVIDQFEELLTLSAALECDRFIELVLGALEHAPDRFKLVITLRADCAEGALRLRGLHRLLERSVVYLSAELSQADYRDIILKPAAQVGLQVEPELVEVLLRDLERSRGELALLEFVLEQLWERRAGGWLTLRAYRQQIGGIEGALERKAEEVFGALCPQARACAHWLFLSLTQLGEGMPDTRRRVRKADLLVPRYGPALVEHTLKAFSDARLIVIGAEENRGQAAGTGSGRGAAADDEVAGAIEQLHAEVTVEVAHEVLIRNWSTLRWWLEENRARLRVQRQIEQAAHLWLQSGRSDEFLLSGARLAEAEELHQGCADELTATSNRFIEAGLAQRAALQHRQQRALVRTRLAAGAMGALALVVAVLGGVLFKLVGDLQHNEIATHTAYARSFLSTHRGPEGLQAALRAGRQQLQALSADTGQTRQTESILREALSTVQQWNRIEHPQWVTSVAFSPGAALLASGSVDGQVRLWRPDGTLVRKIATLAGSAAHKPNLQVRFSPDGGLLAVARDDGIVALQRSEGGPVVRLRHPRGVYDVRFSPGEATLATASSDGCVRVWSVEGRLLRTLADPGNPVFALAFSPDGDLIAAASADGAIRLWRRDGRLGATLRGHRDWALAVAVSPDGRVIASGDRTGAVRLWSREGHALKSLRGHSEAVFAVAFSPDGALLATAGFDRTVRLWRPDGTPAGVLQGHSSDITSLSFGGDGQTLATASLDRTVRLWRLQPPLRRTLYGHTDGVLSARFSPDGALVASAGDDRTIRLWSRDGKPLAILRGHAQAVLDVAFSPRGDSLATGGGDGTVRLWRRDGTALGQLSGHTGPVHSLRYSPDGHLLATAGETVRLWNAQGALQPAFGGTPGGVLDVAFSPRGDRLATGGGDGTVRLWRRDGTALGQLSGHTGPVHSLRYSPDGHLLATAGEEGMVRIWETDGRLRQSWAAHADWIDALAFSPDGRTLATAGHDRLVKLWSLDGTLLKVLEGHAAPVTSVGFSPDSRTVISAGLDKTVLLWDDWQLDVAGLVARGCNWLAAGPDNTPNRRCKY
ncbi:MAG: caspase family protein [Aphanocapsa lilacina HA4352-LM1]|jgi:WD40 repeat protein/uncharacterized caspase-like protein|nr:caspase family protein [Aphanocapsa lilacina HA4352-LM1]